MKNKRLCLSGAGDQHDEKDGEEGIDDNYSNAVALISSERCPICLNNLPQEVGFPEGCCHAFCISCILKWCEMSSSCPVDRKPFQTVYKMDSTGCCTKIPILAREDESCSCSLCMWCCTKSKICFRLEVKGPTNKISCFSTNSGCRDRENFDFELKNLASHCFNADVTTEHHLDPLETLQHSNG
ncbi:protein SCAF11-like [Gastrophryne carolinensis]